MKYLISISKYLFVFFCGMLVVFYFKGCFNSSKQEVKYIKVQGKKYEVLLHDTLYRTITKNIYKKGEKFYYIDSMFIKVPEKVDTQLILKKYYSLNMYLDTYKTDLGNVIIKDTISQNKIIGRTYSSILKFPEYHTIVKEKPKSLLYAGVGVGLTGKGNIVEYSTHIYLKAPKNALYGIGVGVIDGKPNYKLNLAIKL